jgi:hypothetical protein
LGWVDLAIPEQIANGIWSIHGDNGYSLGKRVVTNLITIKNNDEMP